jgi:hypothetical protein
MTRETQSQAGRWKNKRPNIEEWVNYCFDGVLREQALEFAEWVRRAGFKHKIHSSTNNGHNVFYNKEYMCKILINKEKEDRPMYWTIQPCLSNLSKYEYIIKNEGLAVLPWKPNYCIHKKEPDKTKINNTCSSCPVKGVDRLMFGDEFTQCCKLFPSVKNPNEAELNRIKRLLELEKMARDNQEI